MSAGGEFKIVRLAGMRISEIVCRETVLTDQAVQVRHRGTSDNVGVIGVFLDDNEDVTETHLLALGAAAEECWLPVRRKQPRLRAEDEHE
jgi:hypothetical protein